MNTADKMRIFFSKNANIVFLGMIMIQMLVYNYVNYLDMEPRSIHSWRQSDCLSFILNFYNGRTTFLEPGVSNLGITGDGKAASDFPIIQYLIAQFWKVIGVSTLSVRLINLAFLVLGLVYTYKIFSYCLKEEKTVAILAACLVFTSPILSYYGPTPLSDIQAFGLGLAGFYYAMRWLDHYKAMDMGLFILLFSLAGLLKLSSSFLYAVVLGFWFSRVLFGNQEQRTVLWNIKNILLLCLPFIPPVIWYSYASHYNKLYPNDFFLVGILPVWIMSMDKFTNHVQAFNDNIVPQMFHKYFWFLLISGLISFFILRIKSFFSEVCFRMLIPVLLLLTFLILFFDIMDVHDYYLINMMPLVIVFMALLLKEAKPMFADPRRYLWVLSGLFLITVVLTYNTAMKTRYRLNANEGWGVSELVFSEKEHEYLKWNTWDDRRKYSQLEKMKQELEQLGIRKFDHVLCLGDNTLNRSLYLIDRLGYTSCNVNLEWDPEFIERNKKNGLSYLIIIDPDFLSKKELQPYLKNKIYEREATSIYKL